MTNIYLKLDIYKDFLILAENHYHNSDHFKESPSVGYQRRRELYASIIFLSFALESFINDISIRCFEKDFESFEKLSTPDKWYLIPRLKTLYLFEKSTQPFQSIDLTFKYRNILAHNKPQFQKQNCKEYNKLLQITPAFVRQLYDHSIQAMIIIRKNFKIKNLEWLDDKKLLPNNSLECTANKNTEKSIDG